MKWFKHVSDSINDPFIADLIESHGPFGYFVFFGILEIYSREFKIADGWVLDVSFKFIRDSLHMVSTRKLQNFFKTSAIVTKWRVKTYSKNGSDRVQIYIPKFLELIDETTRKKMSEHEAKLRNRSGMIPAKKKKKKKKKEIIKEKRVSGAFGEFKNVQLSADEHKKLLEQYPGEIVDEYIGKVDRYVETSGRKYKSHYATILTWLRKDKIGSVKDLKKNGHPECTKCRMAASNIERGKPCPYCGDMVT